ncbi:hypothetical protein [Sphaerisporangium fuscum]|uniref:hypothetical protein n=1 Tax=Sphaerisporangium fuscum TaxID=2835868 RepID=UPI001BDC724E|nr:hypothetical protein [Sphaerisporangium fuscum]
MAAYVTDSSGRSADADDQSIAGDVDDLGGDPVDAVEFHHPFGLFQKSGDQPEVACGGAVDRGDGLSGSGVRDVQAKVGEGCGQDDDDEFGVEAGTVEVGLAIGVVDVAGADDWPTCGDVSAATLPGSRLESMDSRRAGLSQITLVGTSRPSRPGLWDLPDSGLLAPMGHATCNRTGKALGTAG